MARRKTEAADGSPGQDGDGPWRYEGGEWVRPDDRTRLFDFGNSSVLITHPSVNGGESVSGTFTGSWATVPTGRTSFAVTAVRAQLVLPSVDLVLAGARKAARVQPGSIYLSTNTFDVPAHLAEMFPAPNTGVFRPGNRYYSAVFGLHAVFPFAHGGGRYLELEPASVLLRTVGYVQRDGSLVASGIGTILDGLLKGLMLACGHPSKEPAKPKPCGAKMPNASWLCSLESGHPGQHANRYSGNFW